MPEGRRKKNTNNSACKGKVKRPATVAGHANRVTNLYSACRRNVQDLVAIVPSRYYRRVAHGSGSIAISIIEVDVEVEGRF
jgi:hypothetical protein